jgi:hypothetical protein
MTIAALTKALHAPYFQHPDAEIAEEIIRGMRSETKNLGRMSLMLAMLEAHPEHAEEWRKKYRFYIERAERYKEEYPLNGVGWNDYHMMRWLILGDPDSLEEIVSRYHLGGQVGETARWMVDSVTAQCPSFFHAFHALNSANVKPPEVSAPAGGNKE